MSDLFQNLQPTNLIKTSETDLPKFAQSLVENYNVLSAEDMLKEIAHLRRFLKSAKVTNEESLGCTSLSFLEFVIEYELSYLLLNFILVLRLFLTFHCFSFIM